MRFLTNKILNKIKRKDANAFLFPLIFKYIQFKTAKNTCILLKRHKKCYTIKK